MPGLLDEIEQSLRGQPELDPVAKFVGQARQQFAKDLNSSLDEGNLRVAFAQQFPGQDYDSTVKPQIDRYHQLYSEARRFAHPSFGKFMNPAAYAPKIAPEDAPEFEQILQEVAPQHQGEMPFALRLASAPGKAIVRAGRAGAGLLTDAVASVGLGPRKSGFTEFIDNIHDTVQGAEAGQFQKEIKDDNWASWFAKKAAMGIAENAPLMVGALGAGKIGAAAGLGAKPAAAAGLFSVYYPQTQQEALREYRRAGASSEMANKASLLVAVPMTLIEGLGANKLIGAGLVAELKKGFLRTFGKALLTEWGEEAAQKMMEQSGKWILSQIDPAVKFNWSDEQKELVDQTMEAFPAVFGLVLGGGAYREIGRRGTLAQARLPDLLQAAGQRDLTLQEAVELLNTVGPEVYQQLDAQIKANKARRAAGSGETITPQGSGETITPQGSGETITPQERLSGKTNAGLPAGLAPTTPPPSALTRLSPDQAQRLGLDVNVEGTPGYMSPEQARQKTEGDAPSEREMGAAALDLLFNRVLRQAPLDAQEADIGQQWLPAIRETADLLRSGQELSEADLAKIEAVMQLSPQAMSAMTGLADPASGPHVQLAGEESVANLPSTTAKPVIPQASQAGPVEQQLAELQAQGRQFGTPPSPGEQTAVGGKSPAPPVEDRQELPPTVSYAAPVPGVAPGSPAKEIVAPGARQEPGKGQQTQVRPKSPAMLVSQTAREESEPQDTVVRNVGQKVFNQARLAGASGSEARARADAAEAAVRKGVPAAALDGLRGAERHTHARRQALAEAFGEDAADAALAAAGVKLGRRQGVPGERRGSPAQRRAALELHEARGWLDDLIKAEKKPARPLPPPPPYNKSPAPTKEITSATEPGRHVGEQPAAGPDVGGATGGAGTGQAAGGVGPVPVSGSGNPPGGGTAPPSGVRPEVGAGGSPLGERKRRRSNLRAAFQKVSKKKHGGLAEAKAKALGISVDEVLDEADALLPTDRELEKGELQAAVNAAFEKRLSDIPKAERNAKLAPLINSKAPAERIEAELDDSFDREAELKVAEQGTAEEMGEGRKEGEKAPAGMQVRKDPNARPGSRESREADYADEMGPLLEQVPNMSTADLEAAAALPGKKFKAFRNMAQAELTKRAKVKLDNLAEDGLRGLPEAQQATYRAAWHKAISLIPKQLLKVVAGLRKVKFYASKAEVHKYVKDHAKEHGNEAKLAELAAREGRGELVGAAFVNGVLHLDGAHDDFGFGVYLHEIGHEIGHQGYDTSAEWIAIFDKELKEHGLLRYAGADAVEGFAEFFRLYTQAVTNKGIIRRFAELFTGKPLTTEGLRGDSLLDKVLVLTGLEGKPLREMFPEATAYLERIGSGKANKRTFAEAREEGRLPPTMLFAPEAMPRFDSAAPKEGLLQQARKNVLNASAILHDIAKAAKQGGQTVLDMLSTYRESGHLAEKWLREGITDENGNKLAGSFMETLEGLEGQEREDFLDWYRALGDIDEHRALRNPGRSFAEATRVANAPRGTKLKDYRRRAALVIEHFNAQLDVLVETGAMSPKLAQNIKKNYPHYFPNYRLKPGARISAGLHGRKGGTDPRLDPGDAAAIRASRIAASAAMRKRINAVLDALPGSGLEDLAQNVTGGEPSITELRDRLDADGFDLTGMTDDQVRQLAEHEYAVFERAAGTHYTRWESGVKVTYKLTPELYQAFKGMQTENEDLPMKLVRAIGNGMRLATRLSPDWALRQPFKDLANFIGQRQSGEALWRPLEVLIRLVSRQKGEFLSLWQKSGGPYSRFLNMSPASINRTGDEIAGRKPGSGVRVWRLGEDVFGKTGDVLQFGDTMYRAAHFKNVLLKKGWTEEKLKQLRLSGESIPEADLAAAMQAAHERQVDFRERGEWFKDGAGKVFAALDPYLNANMAGKRNFWNMPRSGKAVVAASYAVPAMILWALFHDDDWYKEAEPADKWTHMIVPQDGKPLLRIPMSDEMSLVYGAMQAILDQTAEAGPEAAKKYTEFALRSLVPPVDVGLLGPMFEVAANYDVRGQRPIVGRDKEKLPPAEQVRSDTLATSRGLAVALSWAGVDVSPAKLQHLLNRMTGRTFGQFAEPIERLARGELPEPERTPGPGGIMVRTEPRASLNDFYEKAKEVEKKYNSARADQIAAGRAAGLSAEESGRRARAPAELEKEHWRYDTIRGFMAKVRAERPEGGKDERFEVDKYLTGLARLAEGKPVLERYPNPLTARDLPPSLKAPRDGFLASIARQATETKPMRRQGEALAGYDERKREWQEKTGRAKELLRQSGAPAQALIEALKADAIAGARRRGENANRARQLQGVSGPTDLGRRVRELRRL